MARSRKTHTQKWWDTAPPHILRCTGYNRGNGERCKSEASPGTTVCDRHGALIPVVQASAARRIQMSEDEAAKQLVDWMNDSSVDMRERVKIAHDLLDRGGMAATSKHLIGVVGANDPVESLFLDLLGSPDGLAPAAPPPLAPDPVFDALNASVDQDDEDLIGAGQIVDAELVEEVPAATPARIEQVEEASRKGKSAKPPKHIRDAMERLL